MSPQDFMLPCFIKTIFGVECMGCGAQRAFLLVLQGQFIEALYLFPAIYTLLLLFITVILHFVHKGTNYTKAIKIIITINLIVMLVFYLYHL